MLTISQWRSQENRGGSPDCNVPEVGGLPHRVLSPSPASLTITALTVCNILTDCLRCFHSNQLDKDRVWTFGSGPRMCVGHKFIHKIIKVSFYSWIPFAKVAYCVIANNSLLAIFRNGAGEEITKLNPCLWHFGAWAIYLAWENSQGHDWFPRGMTSEQRLQKFHTDDVNSPHLGQGGSSDWPCRERNLLQPIRSTIPHVGNGTSSVWNFSARSSEIILHGIAQCRLYSQASKLTIQY